jgi:hypothetical protein
VRRKAPPSERGLGKIRLVTPRPRFGGDCKDIPTHRSTNTDSSGYVYDPIEAAGPLGSTKDDQELYGDDITYKGHK